MTRSHNLTIAERATLKRLHGLTVTREVEGVAYCCNAKGERCQFAIDHLRSVLAHRPLRERVVNWLAGVSA